MTTFTQHTIETAPTDYTHNTPGLVGYDVVRLFHR